MEAAAGAVHVPFSFAGDDGAPLLWIVVARAGGILAYAMAYRLAARLAGPIAGVIAACSLFLADESIRNFARGNSEGILVALCLWAIERHLDGRRRDAFLLGIAAALLRPEVWPFIALYGLFLILIDRRVKTVVLVLGGGLALVILWFVPEYLGSGDFLRAANRARQPNPDSAAFAAFPFLEVFRRSASVLTAPVYVGAAIAVVIALRDRSKSIALAMAAVSTVLMISVGLMTQAGFAGNLRYIALPAAFVCILAGAGWVWLVKGTGRRFGPVAAGALVVLVAAVWAPFAISDIKELDRAAYRISEEADLYGTLAAAIDKGGGAGGAEEVRHRVQRQLPDPGGGLVHAPARDGSGDLRLPARHHDRRQLLESVPRPPFPGGDPNPQVDHRVVLPWVTSESHGHLRLASGVGPAGPVADQRMGRRAGRDRSARRGLVAAADDGARDRLLDRRRALGRDRRPAARRHPAGPARGRLPAALLHAAALLARPRGRSRRRACAG